VNPQEFDSTKAAVPAVKGVNTSTPTPGVVGSSVAVEGQSDAGFGVYGHSISGRGVVAQSDTNYGLRASSNKLSGIRSSSVEGTGVEGAGAECGVRGGSSSPNGTGVLGLADAGTAVAGRSNSGPGMHGASGTNIGIIAESNQSIGLRATSRDNIGVWGASANHEGVHAETTSTGTAALAVYQKNGASNTPALFAKHDGNRLAAIFEGSVVITGDISMNHADCAEDFQLADGCVAEPGAVMVLDDEGNLRESGHAYDKRVAGVISGAGSFKPGIVLDRRHEVQENRRPLALLGKVFCKADAQFGPIRVGDLLTTSPTPGCAMRADDPIKSFGAVIGKALQPLTTGQALIPILIALQ
jgi:hypothetical protein